MHGARREALGVETEITDHVAREALGVGLVVDAERLRVAETFGMDSQDAHTRRVEGGDPHRPGDRTHQSLDAVLHLTSRFVGERDGEDVGRMHSVRTDEMSDAVREHPGLARSGASHHQKWAVDVFGGVTLRRVQPAQIDRPGPKGGVVDTVHHEVTSIGNRCGENGCGRPSTGTATLRGRKPMLLWIFSWLDRPARRPAAHRSPCR